MCFQNGNSPALGENPLKHARSLSLLVTLVLFIEGSFLAPAVLSLNTTSQTIQSYGEILSLPPPIPNPQLRVNGLYLADGLGNQVKLKGVIADWNERVKKYGTTQLANSPEESWFTESDVVRIKEAGGNCIEIHQLNLPELMPTRNVPNEAYFATWIDKYVAWCSQNGVYCILDINSIGARWDWEIALTYPNWLWQGIYSQPTTQTQYDDILKDFFDLSVTKQDVNRQAFINLWTYIANRYKDDPYVMFSIINEPFIGTYYMHSDVATYLGQSYSNYMTIIIDAIRSTGAQQIVIVNKPYLWNIPWSLTVERIDRSNIVWEDHVYVEGGSNNLNNWFKVEIDKAVQKFVTGFQQPLFIGEYGFDPKNVIRTDYPTTWRQILADEVAYLDSKPLAGRQWHSWGHINGEYYPFESPDISNLTAEESEYIIQTVMG